MKLLNKGVLETRNLAEWLAVDMALLFESVLEEFGAHDLGQMVRNHSSELRRLGVTRRLRWIGEVIAEYHKAERLVGLFAAHRSDVVRQFATYGAVSRETQPIERLQRVIQFAADTNMSVRECAWMAVRPTVAADLGTALSFLEGLSVSSDANVRRFAVEVCRPRSVWGQHIPELKNQPQLAITLLEKVRADSALYVRLAVGNWLNDASKTRPEWVQVICNEWLSESSNRDTIAIVRRGLRTIRRGQT